MSSYELLLLVLPTSIVVGVTIGVRGKTPKSLVQAKGMGVRYVWMNVFVFRSPTEKVLPLLL
jgi:hypothetical protein